MQKSDEESYLVSSFNIVAYFYGEEFIERARALTLSFRLDINEGFYSHLLLSPGDYRFTFRNLKKYKDIFALKASKHWAQSFQIDTENDLYDIAIDKEERRSSLEEYYNLYTGNQNSGYLSLFHEKLFILKGLFNYKRKGFSIGGQEIKSGGITFYDFKDPEKKYYPIIESQDPNNVVNLKFAQDNPVFVEATIDGNYKAHFEDALVYEINQKQFYGWESVGTPPVLVKLTSSHEPIYVDNSIERGKRVLVTGNTRFFSEQDSSQEVFLRTMYEYEQDFEFCVDKVRPAYFENKDQYTIMDWMKE
ncbi:MAG: hypothetical protein QF915_03070 [Candidatus Woesearchaeota archaeon]|nr:hypothetical protein [Candidatus Woesearchaeota archaeon]